MEARFFGPFFLDFLQSFFQITNYTLALPLTVSHIHVYYLRAYYGGGRINLMLKFNTFYYQVLQGGSSLWPSVSVRQDKLLEVEG